jgi:hypothetical protein
VQLLNGALCYSTVVIVDKSKPAGPARVAIGRNDNLDGVADGSEVLADVGFVRAIGEIPDE